MVGKRRKGKRGEKKRREEREKQERERERGWWEERERELKTQKKVTLQT